LLRTFLEIQVRAALAGNNLEGPARQLLGHMAQRLGVSMVELAQIEAVLRIRSGTFRQQTTINTATSSCDRLTACWNARRAPATTTW